jgi:SNF2 family DNA or RNA helicase
MAEAATEKAEAATEAEAEAEAEAATEAEAEAAKAARAAKVTVRLSDAQGVVLARMERMERELSVGKGGIVACHAGFGKTYLAATLCRTKPLWPVLIVVPKTVITQWVAALRACGVGDTIRVLLKRCRTEALEVYNYATKRDGVVLTTPSCATVLLDESVVLWGRVIFDEAHVAKNPNTDVHRVMKQLGRRAAHVWALTATPINNCARDLMSLTHLIGINGDIDAELVREHYMISVPSPESDTDTLHVRKQVIRMPEGSWEDDVCQSVHDQFNVCSAESGRSSMPALELQIRCLQAATHPLLYYKSVINKRGYLGDADDQYLRASRMRVADGSSSSKVAYLVSDIQRCGGTDHGVIVYCDWDNEMSLIADELRSVGVTAFLFSGKLTIAEREDVIQLFGDAARSHEVECDDLRAAVSNADGVFPPPCVMLVQVRCGSVGLNLQNGASRVYVMRPPHNPAVQYQGICRVHRRGQTRPVTVVELVTAGTLDESCYSRQNSKLTTISEVLRDDTMIRVLGRQLGVLDLESRSRSSGGSIAVAYI